MLLSCKGGTTCIERLAAGGLARPPLRLLAFSISSLEQGEAVLRGFKTLRASVAGPAKKQDAVGAGYLPARRASRLEPLEALRGE